MKYQTVVADPPWPMGWSGGAALRRNGRGEVHVNHQHAVRELAYPKMSVEAIEALPVAELAADDAHLYLWIPDSFLIDGVAGRVIRAWGFDPKRTLVWEKTGFGLGSFPRPQHEIVVCAKRGNLDYARRDVGSVHRWKLVYEGLRRKHSAKPDGFLDLVETVSPAPRLELFARRQRLGWDTWGNEALNHIEMTA